MKRQSIHVYIPSSSYHLHVLIHFAAFDLRVSPRDDLEVCGIYNFGTNKLIQSVITDNLLVGSIIRE